MEVKGVTNFFTVKKIFKDLFIYFFRDVACDSNFKAINNHASFTHVLTFYKWLTLWCSLVGLDISVYCCVS